MVCNKVQPGVAEISKADFEASIERKINYAIPFDQKAAVNAAKLGQTFAEANKNAKATAPICEIARLITGISEDDGAALANSSKGGSSLLGKLDLKALLGGSKAKTKATAAQ